MTKPTPVRWLIGGPARCGKSALAQALHRDGTEVAVMRVDALLHRYLGAGPFGSEKEARAFLSAYLGRPRFMDPECKVTLRPADDFPAGEEAIFNETGPVAGRDGVSVVFAALDAMARMRGKRGWAILDLHPEFYFRRYAAANVSLSLLVCLRDPLEAVAASLCWRDFPGRCARPGSRLRYAARLWRMSAAMASTLRREFPDRVHVVSSNAMFADAGVLPRGLTLPGDAFGRLFGGDALFTSRETATGCEFLCPDGSWRALLDAAELEYLRPLHKEWERMAGSADGRVPGDLLFQAAARWPMTTKRAVDFAFDPLLGSRRAMARSKRLFGISSTN